MNIDQVTNQATLLEHVSKQAAAVNRPWLALTAQVAGDTLRVLQLSQETGEKVSPDIFDFALTPSPPLATSRLVQEAHRNNVLSYLTERARDRALVLWSGLEHLEQVASPTSEEIGQQESARLQGSSSRERRTYLATYAKNMHRMSAAMETAGMLREAFRAAYRADLAAFEVFCFDQAAHTGDTRLASIDLRMAMAQMALGSVLITDDLSRNRAVIRNALSYATFAADDVPWIA